MNLELIYSPLYTVDVTRPRDDVCPRGVGPIVARPTTRRRAISTVVARATPVIACSRPVVARSQPYAPDLVPVVGCCVPVIARIFFNFRTRRLLDCYFCTCRRPVVLVIARCATRRRNPSRACLTSVCASPISTRARSYFSALY